MSPTDFREAVLGFDIDRAREVLARAREDHPLAHAWLAVFSGDADAGLLQRIERNALESGQAEVVVDAAALRALALSFAEATGGEAIEHARRASRMARTEGLPEAAPLANWVLARLRRLAGHPYLATRILTALRELSGEPWHPLIAWELALAGGRETRASAPPSSPAEALHELFDAATRVDAGEVHRRYVELRSRVGSVVFARLDLVRVLASLDPDFDSDEIDRSLSNWRNGGVTDPPHGLTGLVRAAGGQASGVVIIARPGQRGRRALCLGLSPLAAHDLRLEPLQRRESRTDAVLAALALAGDEGLSEEDLFSAVWGFAFVRTRHQDVLAMAISRARVRVGDAASLVREGRRVTLTARARIVVPEPRGGAHVDDRVLFVVARHGRATASDLATELGLPLRTVQGALKTLVDEGLCGQHRDGRAVEYQVEDTTFQEPTGVGARR